MSKKLRGIIALQVTPFTKTGDVDEPVLRQLVDFCCDVGAHGISATTNVGEYTSLTDEERKHVIHIVCDQTRKRVPVIIGASGASTQAAIMFAHTAKDAGADAIMVMPPYVRKVGPEGVFAYYKAISDAVDIPIMIQNFVAPVGTPMSGAMLARILKEIEHAEYVKEETIPAGPTMTETIKLAGDRLKGVMSAWQGNNIITEYERGACGATVACHLVDVYVRLWNALEAGNRMEAREIYKRMLPMINYDLMYTPWLYKEVLYRRGLIPNTHTRYDVQRMDRFDLKHVDEILADLREFMAVK